MTIETTDALIAVPTAVRETSKAPTDAEMTAVTETAAEMTAVTETAAEMTAVQATKTAEMTTDAVPVSRATSFLPLPLSARRRIFRMVRRLFCGAPHAKN